MSPSPPDWLHPAVVVAALLVLVALETARPLRPRTQARGRRSLRNAATGALAWAASRPLQVALLLPLAAWCARAELGLLHLVRWPSVLETALALLLLDATLWYWHLANHRLPFLWRFHAVHHEDRDLDATTALRFHFGELALSVGWRALQVLLLGVTGAQLAWHFVLLSASSLFHHSNLRLPLRFERALVPLIVTPRMHGIHHSAVARETNSNYSSLLSIWDRLHRTLRLDVPQAEIRIGLPGGPPEAQGVAALQLRPFRRQAGFPAGDGRDEGPAPRRTRLEG